MRPTSFGRYEIGLSEKHFFSSTFYTTSFCRVFLLFCSNKHPCCRIQPAIKPEVTQKINTGCFYYFFYPKAECDLRRLVEMRQVFLKNIFLVQRFIRHHFTGFPFFFARINIPRGRIQPAIKPVTQQINTGKRAFASSKSQISNAF